MVWGEKSRSQQLFGYAITTARQPAGSIGLNNLPKSPWRKNKQINSMQKRHKTFRSRRTQTQIVKVYSNDTGRVRNGRWGRGKCEKAVFWTATQFIIIVLYKQQMRENKAGSKGHRIFCFIVVLWVKVRRKGPLKNKFVCNIPKSSWIKLLGDLKNSVEVQFLCFPRFSSCAFSAANIWIFLISVAWLECETKTETKSNWTLQISLKHQKTIKHFEFISEMHAKCINHSLTRNKTTKNNEFRVEKMENQFEDVSGIFIFKISRISINDLSEFMVVYSFVSPMIYTAPMDIYCAM